MAANSAWLILSASKGTSRPSRLRTHAGGAGVEEGLFTGTPVSPAIPFRLRVSIGLTS